MARLADHLVLMEAGRVLADGALADMLARLDLPMAFGDDAGVVLDGVVGERDERWQLARLRCSTAQCLHVCGRATRACPSAAACACACWRATSA